MCCPSSPLRFGWASHSLGSRLNPGCLGRVCWASGCWNRPPFLGFLPDPLWSPPLPWWWSQWRRQPLLLPPPPNPAATTARRRLHRPPLVDAVSVAWLLRGAAHLPPPLLGRSLASPQYYLSLCSSLPAAASPATMANRHLTPTLPLPLPLLIFPPRLQLKIHCLWRRICH